MTTNKKGGGGESRIGGKRETGEKVTDSLSLTLFFEILYKFKQPFLPKVVMKSLIFH